MLHHKGQFAAAAAEGSAPCSSDDLEGSLIQIYHECFAGLLRYALTITRDRYLAEDAIQECFLRLFVAWREGQVICSPKPWLFRVLRNRLLNDVRRLALSPVMAADTLPDRPDWRPNPETFFWREQVGESLRSSLSARELECLQLRLEGLEYGEIAASLGVRIGTVGAMLARAIKKGRKALRPGKEESWSLGYGV